MENKRIELRRSVINITARCTLKCKLCVMGAPFYENPPHYDYETVARTMDKYFEVVDYVQWFEFSGGEPFMHKDLHKMVKKSMEFSSQFDKLLILTNGTLLPNEELLKILIEYSSRIVIMISHYGELSHQAEALENLMKEHHIECDVKVYYGESQHFGGWVDYGDFRNYNRSEEELITLFRECGATKMSGCFTTHGGEMHWCVPSARGMRLLGKVPRDKTDYIDLFDESMSIEEQRAKIKLISEKKYISACNYCSGHHGTSDLSLRHKAAEQIGDE